jgi:glycerol-3-phosphate dehydrogenase
LRGQRLSRSAERCITDRVTLHEEVPAIAVSRWRAITEALSPQTVAQLISRYSMGVLPLFRLLEQNPELARRACAHQDYLAVELVYAIQEECACTITDVLARRTRIAWSACHGLDVLPVLVGWFERFAGISHERMSLQVDDYCRFLTRAKAAGAPAAPTSLVGRFMEQTLPTFS